MATELRSNKSREILAAASVFLISFLIYLSTLAPSIVFGDSADLIISSHLWGVPHPTGYPLFIILSKIFSFLPPGNIAFRNNLFSSPLTSSAITTIYWIILALIPENDKGTRRILPAFTGSLLFAFSYTFWSQSIVTEFFSLEILLISLMILLTLTWMKTAEDRHLYLLAFFFAVTLTLRPTTLFLALAFLYAASVPGRAQFLKPKKLAALAVSLMLGLLPLLYLPLSASRHPLRNWGDVTILANLWNRWKNSLSISLRILLSDTTWLKSMSTPDFTQKQLRTGNFFSFGV